MEKPYRVTTDTLGGLGNEPIVYFDSVFECVDFVRQWQKQDTESVVYTIWMNMGGVWMQIDHAR